VPSVPEEAAFAGLRLAPVRRVRSFDDVVVQIREAILSGSIRPGQRLPSERELCESFGVSRPTLREALRALEALGLVEVRPGSKGGAFAIEPSEDLLALALATLLSFQGATPGEVAEFRISFEGENAELAAARAGASELGVLEELADAAAELARNGPVLGLWELDTRWHEAVARATHNTVRVGIALGIQDAIRRARPSLSDRLVADPTSIGNDMAKLLEALRRRDGRAARAAMESHVRSWSDPEAT
jgi:GntR family transcriptional repressor for pyruvate dehydrogenase complex